ncbi:MAG: hypothetical protein IJ438_12570 [Clostridia bacterium]|nr:hypothetical protein [Clostridia bacterium]
MICGVFHGWLFIAPNFKLIIDEICGMLSKTLETNLFQQQEDNIKMKSKAIHFLAAFTALLCMLAVLPTQAQAEDAPNIVVEMSLDGTEIEAGQPITLTYSITGGTQPFISLSISMTSYCSDNTSFEVCRIDNPPLQGTLTGIPLYGDELLASLALVDTNLGFQYFSIDSIPIINSLDYTPITIDITPSTLTPNAGEPVTFTYEIAGNASPLLSYSHINYSSNYTYSNGEDYGYEYMNIDTLSGTFSYTPPHEGIVTLDVTALLNFEDGAGKLVQPTFTLDVQPAGTEKPARTPGDVNDDGTVNMRDALALLKKLADWDVSINASNADCNADGTVNMRDALLLLKKLADWDVTLQ